MRTTLIAARQRLAPLPEPKRMALLREAHRRAHEQRAWDLAPIIHGVLDEAHVPLAPSQVRALSPRPEWARFTR